MHNDMSLQTRQEVLAKKRHAYQKAGPKYKTKLLDEVIQLFGYHRKAAIRALRAAPAAAAASAPAIIGRPREYSPERLLPIIKPIWFAAYQPCGKRLHALLPEWLPAYEQDHRRLDSDLRQALLRASPRTLDRLLRALRVQSLRRGGTRPGSLLRQSIPIRGGWTEEGPGWLELDTVALCGGALDDLHAWMLDAVDIRTDWTEQRASANRSAHCILEQIRDVEASLPFPLLGIDSDNGGEFINHHLVRYLHNRPQPLCFTRSRSYKSNDNAHIEQRNYTHVRQQFGYERYDNPAVVPPMNVLCKGALGWLLNHFLPTQKLQGKRREGKKIIREYGAPVTPYARVLLAPEVRAEEKKRLQQLHSTLNPMALSRQIEREKKDIEACRLLCA